jgi:hypothetical protein
MLKRNKSYMSTIYPSAATSTGMRKSSRAILLEEVFVVAVMD